MSSNTAPIAAVIGDLPATLDVGQVANLYGMSTWALYEAVKTGKVPVQPLRVGKKLRWPTALVLRSLGIDPATAPDVA
ncbi:DNA-binding protein [Pseudonocardia sp. 73-21]|uniref:DNA-binding protein n=1 Tax=Pseudonocardia sp. 73-21 TaxID=1895809 RepID=UPI0026301122|nr:DNA-binding protein [Pseudonocardia sp. 73-21]